MSDPALNDDFLDMLQALKEANVEFLVVGAHARAAHGIPRATGHFDVWVRPSLENAERVFRALAAFGAPVAAHGISASDFAEEDAVYQIGLPPRRIDLLTSISGVSFDEAWATKMVAAVGSYSFSVAMHSSGTSAPPAATKT